MHGIKQIIRGLRHEISVCERAIADLEALAKNRTNGSPILGNRLSKEGRERISRAAKKRWAAYRRAQGGQG